VHILTINIYAVSTYITMMIFFFKHNIVLMTATTTSLMQA
jgi:hypothetical protein